MQQVKHSWSYSRWQQFNRCERAYYYQYLQAEQPKTANINRFRKLAYADHLVGTILYETTYQFFQNSKQSLNRNLQKKEFFKLLFKLYKKYFSPSAKNNIYEVYYNEVDNYKLFAESYYQKLSNTAELFFNSELFSVLSSTPYLNFKWTNQFASFCYYDIEVWTRAMLTFQRKEQLHLGHIINKKIDTNLETQLAINALLVHYNFNVDINNISFNIFSITENFTTEFYITAERIQELKSIILTSNSEFHQKKVFNQSAECLNKLNKNAPVRCKFKELCLREVQNNYN